MNLLNKKILVFGITLFSFLSALSRQQDNSVMIGIGYFTDTPSNISYQYTIYDLLTSQPMFKSDGTRLMPMLTLRRGLTEYYINGYMSPSSIFCNVWHKGKLETTIKIYGQNGKTKTLESFYEQLNNTIADGLSKKKRQKYYAAPYTSENFIKKYQQKKSYEKLSISAPDKVGAKQYSQPDITVGTVRENLFSYAQNAIPPCLDENMITAYKYSMDGLNAEGLQYIASNDFQNLSMQEKERYIHDYVSTHSQRMLDDIFPTYKNASKIYENGITTAESVADIYGNTYLSGFLFTTDLVSQQLKTQAATAVLPLWKRPGTVITYMFAGDKFYQDSLPDVAIECYSSALLMVDALNVAPSFQHYLKSRIFEKIANTYQRNSQGASAYFAQKLSDLHKRAQYNSVIANDDVEYMSNVNKIAVFFDQVENDARNAKKERNRANANAIALGAVALTSSYADAKAGLSNPSATTQSYVQGSNDEMDKATRISNSSLSATNKAAAVYDQAFRDLINEIQKDNNNFSSTKPLFAIDYIKMLSNDNIAQEEKNEIMDVVQVSPAIYKLVNEYYQNKNDKLLKDIYVGFAKMELSIYNKEALGNVTAKENIALKY